MDASSQKVISSNLGDQEGISQEWCEVWAEIENWYGDPMKRETAEQLMKRIQCQFDIKVKPSPKTYTHCDEDEDGCYCNGGSSRDDDGNQRCDNCDKIV